MKRLYRFLILLTLVPIGCFNQPRDQNLPIQDIKKSSSDPIDVSLVSLLGNPVSYDNKIIRVIGFAQIEFEGTALFLHKEDCDLKIFKNGIWLDIASRSEMASRFKGLSYKYAIIEGLFIARDKGHEGGYSGSIHNINEARLWTFK